MFSAITDYTCTSILTGSISLPSNFHSEICFLSAADMTCLLHPTFVFANLMFFSIYAVKICCLNRQQNFFLRITSEKKYTWKNMFSMCIASGKNQVLWMTFFASFIQSISGKTWSNLLVSYPKELVSSSLTVWRMKNGFSFTLFRMGLFGAAQRWGRGGQILGQLYLT